MTLPSPLYVTEEQDLLDYLRDAFWLARVGDGAPQRVMLTPSDLDIIIAALERAPAREGR